VIPQQLGVKISPQTEDLLRKCLDKDPKKRIDVKGCLSHEALSKTKISQKTKETKNRKFSLEDEHGGFSLLGDNEELEGEGELFESVDFMYKPSAKAQESYEKFGKFNPELLER